MAAEYHDPISKDILYSDTTANAPPATSEPGNTISDLPLAQSSAAARLKSKGTARDLTRAPANYESTA